MAYEFREVKCPWCDHIFMWRDSTREGLVLHRYRLKDTKEFVGEAKCPNCNMNMLVLKYVLLGIDIADGRVEPIYGEFDGYTLKGY